MFGYHGRYLRIDLCSATAQWVPLDEQVLRAYVGGVGLGAWLLLQEESAECDALDPRAALAFVFSPLVGSPLTTSAKFAVVAKSPLTNRFNDSLASSGFALAGKKVGADAIVLVGAAPQLSVLVLDQGTLRVEPAAELAGKSVRFSEQELARRFGRDFQFAVIGPAGERQVRYATISHDGRHAGRGGHGAVLGAKNVKAIAVRGSARCSWADPDRLVALARAVSARSLGPATAKYRELGTAANLTTLNRLEALPTRNFQAGRCDDAEQLAPEALAASRAKVRSSCAACTIGCEHLFAIDKSSPKAGVRVEYENLFALGPLCGLTDPNVVLAASQRCDELGLDTISCGGSIAFAMECVERGLLAAPWLRFGDGGALLRAIELIGRREDVGELLAEGSRRAAEAIGGTALEFAPQVKGLEIPGYEPRALQTMALGFAVGTRGADHNRSGAYEADFREDVDRRQMNDQSAGLAIATEDKAALMDSLILCKFLRGVFEDVYAEAAEMLRWTTGWEVTAGELQQTARRIINAKKYFNTRAGWTLAEDWLPERFLSTGTSENDDSRIRSDVLARSIRQYNLLRGWTEHGQLADTQLADLSLPVRIGERLR